MKQLNITDFYAPVGGATKIADFAAKQSRSNHVAKTSNSSNGGAAVVIETASKPDYTLLYIAIGVVVIGGAIYLYTEHQKEKRREEQLRQMGSGNFN